MGLKLKPGVVEIGLNLVVNFLLVWVVAVASDMLSHLCNLN